MKRTRQEIQRAKRALAVLAEKPGMWYDPELVGLHASTLHALRRRKLAKQDDAGYWRITLAGLLEHRRG